MSRRSLLPVGTRTLRSTRHGILFTDYQPHDGVRQNDGTVANSMESDMTKPDKDLLGHAQELENVVDALEQKVAADREAEGVPGKPSDREGAATRGSDDEPPD